MPGAPNALLSPRSFAINLTGDTCAARGLIHIPRLLNLDCSLSNAKKLICRASVASGGAQEAVAQRNERRRLDTVILPSHPADS
jgi:hypothetical protein